MIAHAIPQEVLVAVAVAEVARRRLINASKQTNAAADFLDNAKDSVLEFKATLEHVEFRSSTLHTIISNAPTPSSWPSPWGKKKQDKAKTDGAQPAAATADTPRVKAAKSLKHSLDQLIDGATSDTNNLTRSMQGAGMSKAPGLVQWYRNY